MREKRSSRRFIKVEKQKSIIPKIILTIILWLSLLFIILFFDPDTFLILPLFFLIVSLALFFTFSLILKNKRRSLLISLTLLILLIFKFLGIANIINIILILGISISVETYFWYTNPREQYSQKPD
ncbi:hypothetical protein BH10PAT1_BH10PAT1_2090 [soil metagenome]